MQLNMLMMRLLRWTLTSPMTQIFTNLRKSNRELRRDPMTAPYIRRRTQRLCRPTEVVETLAVTLGIPVHDCTAGYLVVTGARF